MVLRILFSFVFVFGSLVACGQIADDLHLRHYSIEDGLSDNRVLCFAQDKLGFTWMATMNGLNRFDGKSFRIFKKDYAGKNSLLHNIVKDVATDSKDNIWIGYAGNGISVYNQYEKTFHHYLPDSANPYALPAGNTDALYIDKEDNVWIGIANVGLACLHSKTGKFTFYGGLPHIDKRRSSAAQQFFTRLTDLYMDESGLLWLATGDGLYSFDPGKREFAVYRSKPEDIGGWKDDNFNSLCPIGDSVIFTGGWGTGIQSYNRKTNTFKNYLPNPAFPHSGTKNIVTTLLRKSENELWVGTYDLGLCVFNMQEEKFSYMSPEQEAKNNFPPDFIHNCYRDRSGTLWFAHLNGFHTAENKPPFFRFISHKVTRSDNGEYFGVHRIFEDPLTKRIILSTSYADGVNIIYPGGKVAHHAVGIRKGQENVQVAGSIFQDSRNTIWILSRDYIYSYNRNSDKLEKQFQFIPDTSSRTPAWFDVVEDEMGKLWFVSSRMGIFVYDPDIKTHKHIVHEPGNHNSLVTNIISGIAKGPDSKIWIAYKHDGLSAIDIRTGAYTHYRESPNDTTKIIDNRILAVCPDAAGRVWVGTFSGLSMIDRENRVHNFIRGQELLGISVYEILPDKKGNIWFSSTLGLSVLNPGTMELKTFYSGDGLPALYESIALNHGNDGEIYIGTYRGYFRFNPAGAWVTDKPPPVQVTSFHSGKREINVSKEIKESGRIYLQPTENLFMAEFVSIHYKNPSGIQYAYRLKGIDVDWQYAGTKGFASYVNLPGGDYVFETKSRNDAGFWSDVTSIPVTVATPIYKTTWFTILVAMLFASAVFAFYRFRVRTIEKTEAIKTKFNKQLAETEMRALRAQMNPHFIFNCLNSINRYIIKNDHKTASLYLTKFAKLIRLILDNSENHETVLSAEIEALKLYLEIESLRFDHKFRFEIEVDDNINVDNITIPPMIIQPFVENAIWHGLLHKDTTGTLTIRFSESENLLICVVEDDGVGRMKAMELKSKTATTRKSLGLKITEDRISILNARSSVSGGITFEDLTDASGDGRGTRVTIKIPVEVE